MLGVAEPLPVLGVAEPLPMLGVAEPLPVLGVAEPLPVLGVAEPLPVLGVAEPLPVLGVAEPLPVLGVAEPLPAIESSSNGSMEKFSGITFLNVIHKKKYVILKMPVSSTINNNGQTPIKINQTQSPSMKRYSTSFILVAYLSFSDAMVCETLTHTYHTQCCAASAPVTSSFPQTLDTFFADDVIATCDDTKTAHGQHGCCGLEAELPSLTIGVMVPPPGNIAVWTNRGGNVYDQMIESVHNFTSLFANVTYVRRPSVCFAPTTPWLPVYPDVKEYVDAFAGSVAELVEAGVVAIVGDMCTSEANIAASLTGPSIPIFAAGVDGGMGFSNLMTTFEPITSKAERAAHALDARLGQASSVVIGVHRGAAHMLEFAAHVASVRAHTVTFELEDSKNATSLFDDASIVNITNHIAPYDCFVLVDVNNEGAVGPKLLESMKTTEQCIVVVEGVGFLPHPEYDEYGPNSFGITFASGVPLAATIEGSGYGAPGFTSTGFEDALLLTTMAGRGTSALRWQRIPAGYDRADRQLTSLQVGLHALPVSRLQNISSEHGDRGTTARLRVRGHLRDHPGSRTPTGWVHWSSHRTGNAVVRARRRGDQRVP